VLGLVQPCVDVLEVEQTGLRGRVGVQDWLPSAGLS